MCVGVSRLQSVRNIRRYTGFVLRDNNMGFESRGGGEGGKSTRKFTGEFNFFFVWVQYNQYFT